LNQHVIKNKISLFLIGEVINKFKNTKYFNKLDLIWRYNNVQIKKGDEWKTVFLTNKSVIAQGCEQTLGLGLGQSKDIVVVIISLQREKR